MTSTITYAIGHTGSDYYHRRGIPTLLGAKRIARQDIAQSVNGEITIYCEDHGWTTDTGQPYTDEVAKLYGYDDRWAGVG